jgi:ubiquinone/menaquinone biosynthesis C-methylase UbiE
MPSTRAIMFFNSYSYFSVQKIFKLHQIASSVSQNFISRINPFTPILHKRDPQALAMSSKSFHDTHGSMYDRMASGCTRTVAQQFLPDLSPPITSSSYILDNACGTGLVTRLIKSQQPSVRIKCADLAPGVLDVVKAHIAENKWDDVDTEVLDVRDLKTLGDETFTHVITNFGLSPTPDDLDGPMKAAAEIFRVLKKGGVCVVTTWASISPSSFVLRLITSSNSLLRAQLPRRNGSRGVHNPS